LLVALDGLARAQLSGGLLNAGELAAELGVDGDVFS
jgi:hypothetical protein